MKIKADFSELYEAVRPIEIETPPVAIELTEKPPRTYVPIQIADIKDVVSIRDLEHGTGVLSYEGKQVLLYIPDHAYQNQFQETLLDPKRGKKFHVAWCDVLERKMRGNTFDRYTVTNDLSGEFDIVGRADNGEAPRAKVRLLVCQKCMEFLNYKGARRRGYARKVAHEFKIPDFFECYSSVFKFMPSGFKVNQYAYTKDWAQISEQKRQSTGYICEQCAVNLKEHKYLLHVHHVNGVKGDNSASNLRALCADCHRKQPAHDHIFIPHEDMQVITRLRRERMNGIPQDWRSAIEYADSAVKGALDVLRMQNWSPPVVGYEICDSVGEIIAEVEAAWPDKKFAMVLSDADKANIEGWNFKTYAEVLREFD